MSTELPLPQIIIDHGVKVRSWSCKCGQRLGEFSALRSWECNGEIICGKCAQEKSPEYQEWLKEQEVIKKMMWR